MFLISKLLSSLYEDQCLDTRKARALVKGITFTLIYYLNSEAGQTTKPIVKDAHDDPALLSENERNQALL